MSFIYWIFFVYFHQLILTVIYLLPEMKNIFINIYFFDISGIPTVLSHDFSGIKPTTTLSFRPLLKSSLIGIATRHKSLLYENN